MDDVQLSVIIILSGLFVVFLALIILTFIVQIFGNIVNSLQNRKNNSKNGGGEEKAGKAGHSSANVQAAVAVEKGSIPAEVIAVISAAVASMLGSAEGFIVRSVTRSKGSRSGWSLAGLQEETRPF